MSVLSGLAMIVGFAAAAQSDSLTFAERRKRIISEKKRHFEALESLQTILSEDLRGDLPKVFDLIDIDENGLLSNKERQFLYKGIVDDAVDMIFDDSQTLTREEWCAVEFDAVPNKVAPSSDAEQQMICQWEDDIIAEDCEIDFQILTKGSEVLTRGMMADHYYAFLNPAKDWTPAQFENFLFNNKRAPLQKIFTSKALKLTNVKDVTSTVNDCSAVDTTRRSLSTCVIGPIPCAVEVGAIWAPAIFFGVLPFFLGRRALEESSVPLLVSIVSDLASSDDCDFTNCQELHGLLGMLQHNTFCEEGFEENCVWTQNLFMPSVDGLN